MRVALAQLDKEKREKEELRRTAAEFTEVTDTLEAEIKLLRRQLKETRAELEDNRSHILSIQPYVKDTTPEEIGRVSQQVHLILLKSWSN